MKVRFKKEELPVIVDCLIRVLRLVKTNRERRRQVVRLARKFQNRDIPVVDLKEAELIFIEEVSNYVLAGFSQLFETMSLQTEEAYNAAMESHKKYYNLVNTLEGKRKARLQNNKEANK